MTMKKVLLAIDGVKPNRQVFDYAVSLSKRIRAELSIFQIIKPQYNEYKEKIRKKGLLARTFIEGSMMAATFAEAGEHETALDMMAEASKEIKRLSRKSQKAGVHCYFSITSGNPEKEIIDYVNDHRDVVLTIYDVSDIDVNGTGEDNKKKNRLARITKEVSVPLVTVQT
jgi:hypothetical protein